MINIEKNFYVIISIVLAVLIILFTFVFSSGNIDSRSTSKTKTIYYVDHISPALQKVIDLFNQKHKGNLKVETINLSFNKFSTNERKELLARYLRSRNDRIDIFAVDQIWVPRFARWAVPLQLLLDSSEISKVMPNAMQTCRYNDTIVAVPLYIDIAVMFYRSDLLLRVVKDSKIINDLAQSINWDDFIKLHKYFKHTNNPFYIFQADDYEGLLCAYMELMANQNNPLVDSSGNVLINTPEGKKSLQLLVDLVHKYNVTPKDVTYLKENESFKLFGERNGIFLRSWSSMFDDRSEYLSSEIRPFLKMAALPHLPNAKPSSVYGGWNLMISKFSENIPEATKFIKFLLSEESQKIMYEEGGYLPTIKSIYEDAEFVAKNKDLVFFKDLFKSGVHRPFMEGYTNLSDKISYYLNRAIKAEMPVDKALAEAERKIKEKEILVK